MKRFLWPVIALLVTAFLVALFSLPAGGALASVTGHKPKPVSSGGVNFQTNGNLNPGDTFCGPVQQVAGI